MSKNIDPELLISIIERKPIIWDTSIEEYKDKHKKNAAWVEVCSYLIQNFETKDEAQQKLIIQDTMSKWRAIRDNYVRSLKKQAQKSNSENGYKRIRPYTYADQLSFLKRSIELRINESNLENSTNELDYDKTWNIDEIKKEDIAPDISDEIVTPPTINVITMTKRKRSDTDGTSMDFMDAHKTIKSPLQEDEDLAFFYSLLPSVRSLNMDQKLTFRLQTLQLLYNLRNSSIHTSIHPATHINTSN